MTIDEHIEIIRKYLPQYLSTQSQDTLIKDLKENFPGSKDPYKVYRNLNEKSFIYQGDGIIDIPFAVFDPSNGDFKVTYQEGISMSNTCDVSPKNQETRWDKINVQFAGLIPLEKYISKLTDKNIGEDRIHSFLESLKNNRISNLFYLPERKHNEKVILPESFIKFDFNVTLPPEVFNKERYDLNYLENNGDRLFSFSNYGFYLFLTKLSIHYSRIREGVFRDN
jgi:hypothetical protein